MRIILLLLLSISSLVSAEPTELREWKSRVGSKIEARATSLKGGDVTLETSEGRNLVLSLSKLSEEDADFLRKHFRSDLLAVPSFQAPVLEHALGKVVGPIQATEGSSYYLYLPKTLADGADAPLLFYTGPGVSDRGTLERFTSAAELTGVVLAASVESKNQANAFEVNHDHTKKCLEHISETLPVDITRVFFSGTSGGGATALYSASLLECLGAFPYVAYIPRRSNPPKKGLYYFATGAWDFNRYHSAEATQRYKKRATHRMYVGGHIMGSPKIAEEGLIWLYTRHIYEKEKKFPEEKSRFEARLVPYLDGLSENRPHMAYYWTDHILNLCEASGEVRPLLASLQEKLAGDPSNVRYLQGRVALVDFSKRFFATYSSGPPKFAHTTPKIQEEAQKLIIKFADNSKIKNIAIDLMKKTQIP